MATISQINQTLDESLSLKLIAQAYSEIAAIKLQKIRASIERNRNFFQEITQVFRTVRVAASKKHLTPFVKNGTISILITSNHRFYGSLEDKLIHFFITNSSEFSTERLVIGKTALDFLQSMKKPLTYKSVVFKNDLPALEELRNLVVNLMSYQQILVYYSRMQSVLVQEPHVVDILQKPPEHYLATTGRSFEYIFEPELEKIIQFFDRQIATLLFEQTFFESELARTASRLISMDQAQSNAEDLIKQQKRLLFVAKRSMDSARLLDTIATAFSFKGGKYAN